MYTLNSSTKTNDNLWTNQPSQVQDKHVQKKAYHTSSQYTTNSQLEQNVAVIIIPLELCLFDSFGEI